MATYSEMRMDLIDIAGKNRKYRKLITEARATILTAYNSLNAMQTEYSGLVASINSAAIANPTVEAYQDLKGEKDLLVIDFQNLKTYANNLLTAYDGVSE